MLLTTCPKCAAKFKVHPDQLNVRQGRVMCGRCRHVFNAFESLQRQPDDDTAGRRVEEIEAALSAPPEASAAFGKIEPSVPPELMQSPSPSPSPPAIDPPLDQPILAGGDESFDERVQPEYVTDGPEAPVFESNPLLKGPAPSAAPPVKERRWLVGVLALVLVAGLQATFYFRALVIQTYPQARPMFAALCDAAGCSLPWGRDEMSMKIAWSDLVEPPGKPGRILLTAALTNRARTRQDLPAIELRLTDNADQVLMSRILQPADYLGRPVAKGESLEPGAELVMSMTLDVGAKSVATGYALRPFFP